MKERSVGEERKCFFQIEGMRRWSSCFRILSQNLYIVLWMCFLFTFSQNSFFERGSERRFIRITCIFFRNMPCSSGMSVVRIKIRKYLAQNRTDEEMKRSSLLRCRTDKFALEVKHFPLSIARIVQWSFETCWLN